MRLYINVIQQYQTFFGRIANVILQSGFTVPEWILRLPKPSKMKRKQMGKFKRADSINPARNIGRRDAVKKRFTNIISVQQIWFVNFIL